ncbi:MAG: hypothetical protein SNJ54_16510, partial [Anaerolineae bacterium]
MKAVQPLLIVPPLLLALAGLACGTVVTDQAYYTCPTPIPSSSPTAQWLPGTPLPPLIIPPIVASPTPYTRVAPQDFYLDDAVFVGPPNAPLRLRFRLQHVQVQPVGAQNLVTWRLEVRNVGTSTYEAVPPALMLITRITTAHGTQRGAWRSSEAAMRAAGFTHENYAPLPSGATRVYRLAAYLPAGRPEQFAYL